MNSMLMRFFAKHSVSNTVLYPSICIIHLTTTTCQLNHCLSVCEWFIVTLSACFLGNVCVCFCMDSWSVYVSVYTCNLNLIFCQLFVSWPVRSEFPQLGCINAAKYLNCVAYVNAACVCVCVMYLYSLSHAEEVGGWLSPFLRRPSRSYTTSADTATNPTWQTLDNYNR